MSFEEAVDKVLDHEGGFVDDPADRGGMTFMGISRRWFPDEPFWEKIDTLLDEGRSPNEAMGELRPDVKDFYRREFWNKHGCETLPESIKERHFDFTINAGAGSSTKVIQTLGNVFCQEELGGVIDEGFCRLRTAPCRASTSSTSARMIAVKSDSFAAGYSIEPASAHPAVGLAKRKVVPVISCKTRRPMAYFWD